MRISLASTLLIALVISAAGSAQVQTKNQSTRNIVFVCEHGAALSVVAAAYFNKLAREQHLDMHAIARGVTPQENPSAGAEAGLKKDGIPSEVTKPQALTQDDLAHADYVVTFVALPEKLAVHSPVEHWDDVQWNAAEYDKVRDAIVKHLRQLLETLKTQAKAH